MSHTYKGSHDGAGLRIAIVVARFNDAITLKLLDGAQAGLAECSVADSDIDIAWVPGAFELPVIAQELAETERYDAVICLGAVIRGETPHFQFVAGEAARGVQTVALETGVPAVFGVITPDTDAQAEARAGGAKGNKGFDAALTAIEMANLLRKMRER